MARESVLSAVRNRGCAAVRPGPVPACPASLEFGDRVFVSWRDLRRYASERQPLGLCEPNPLELVAVVAPAGFGPRSFDTISQTFTWEVYDRVGQPLDLSLPFREWSQDAIRILEALSPGAESSWRVLVRLGFQSNQLTAEPVSVLRDDDPENPVFNLAFDALPQKADAAPNVTSTDARDDDQWPDDYVQPEPEDDLETVEGLVAPGTFLHELIRETDQRLQTVAEAGTKRGVEAHREWCGKMQRRAHSAGLTVLAKTLEEFSTSSRAVPRALLKARYIADVHGQAFSRLA